MKLKTIHCLALSLSGVFIGCSTTHDFRTAPAANSTTAATRNQANAIGPATPEQMQWWRAARFGMFIHWDMSSVAGTEISWSRNGSRPLDVRGGPAGYVEDPVYDHLYERFNPAHFNARQWVKLARAAGMKYIVFTAKHHGGFCMWDTELTDYSIMRAPFHRDVVKELADACHKAGMRFGVYYSPRDWHQPDYGIGDNQKYVDYMNGQLRELLNNYGKIDVLWFDSYGGGDLVNFWRIGETFDLVKSLQPNILINNRLAVLAAYNKQPAPYRGDFDTPEQKIGAFQVNRPWESCMSLVTAKGGGWSYRPDGKVKSLPQCVQTLVNCAVGDGNLLLDVGPNSLGEIPADQTGRLLEIGKWLDRYGDSIYGTRGGPLVNGEWGGTTYRGKKVWVHVLKWNGETLRLDPLGETVKGTRVLTGGRAKVIQTGKNLEITLPKAQQDPLDTVIELTLDRPVAER